MTIRIKSISRYKPFPITKLKYPGCFRMKLLQKVSKACVNLFLSLHSFTPHAYFVSLLCGTLSGSTKSNTLLHHSELSISLLNLSL